MGIWYMSLSDYMGGRYLWKFNSMGGGVQKKCLLPPPGIFFWNSPKLPVVIKIFVLSIFEWSFYTGFTVQCA